MNKKKFELIAVLSAAVILLTGFGFAFGRPIVQKLFVQVPSQSTILPTVSDQTPQQDVKVPEIDSAPQAEVASNSTSVRVPVLMYHYIGDLPQNADRTRRDLTVSTADFTAQMDYLKAHGYKTVTTVQLYSYSQGQFSLPSKPIVVSFDDGYLDTFQNAVPVLKARGMVGVFAIITQYPGFPAYAPWDMVISAQHDGMEIIPHTRHHIDVRDKKYTPAQVTDEVQGSITDIQQKLGTTPVAFIYPYGHHTPDEEAILKNDGIKIAFTTDYGWYRKDENQLEIPRVRVHGVETIQRFEDLLLGKKLK